MPAGAEIGCARIIEPVRVFTAASSAILRRRMFTPRHDRRAPGSYFRGLSIAAE
jgi:hypothetical protein